jgi:uncharacterized membrane protein
MEAVIVGEARPELAAATTSSVVMVAGIEALVLAVVATAVVGTALLGELAELACDWSYKGER